MKIAVVGKGGVGKTTVTSLLASHYAAQGRPVLAIDADPSPCLGPALAFPPEKLAQMRPIADLEDLIAERTGRAVDSASGFFKLNPRVSDLPAKLGQEHNGIQLLMLGSVKHGGSGCICPASTMLQQLVRHILLASDEVVLLDLYAGVEHLGRGTAEAVDAMLVVAEPTHRSLATAAQIKDLAADLGITNLYLVGNKVQSASDQQFLEEFSPGLPVLGFIGTTDAAVAADRSGRTLYGLDPVAATAIAGIAERVEADLEARLSPV